MNKSDKAYLKMISIADEMEKQLGERTNSECIYEGRKIFKYVVLFCDENENVTEKKINVKL